MRKTIITAMLVVATLDSAAQGVDFDLIQHWAGEGEKRAALVVQFNDGKKDVAYVWGYRWNGSASGEDMIRSIARSSHSLTALVQYTGSMGSTLDGVGVSRNRCLQDGILYFDYTGAKEDYRISYKYDDPNILMGQESAPGDDAEDMCNDAIRNAFDGNTGIIEHPLNARRYGYPAYDYDYWRMLEESEDYHWQAGWYDGYWSYWVGQQGEELVYSGLGMSSAQLADGSVNLWNYVADMTEMGTAPDPTENLDYEMADFDEYMSQPDPIIYPVDFNRIRHWAGNGNGEKFAAVVVKFNDGKGPESIVTGYKWTGGWDDNVATVLKSVFESDSRFHVEMEGQSIKSISYDSDGNGVINDSDHQNLNGTWQTFADYSNESEIFEVASRRFINPRAVLILTHSATDTEPDYDISSFTYRPSLDETALAIPEKMTTNDKDTEVRIPFFAQNIDMTGSISGLVNGSIPAKINGVANGNINLDISQLTSGEHKVTISVGTTGTRANTISNECLLTVNKQTGLAVVPKHINEGSLACKPDGTLVITGFEGYQFSIMDMTGRTVAFFTVTSDNFSHKIPVANGIYVAHGVAGDKTVTLKFINNISK